MPTPIVTLAAWVLLPIPLPGMVQGEQGDIFDRVKHGYAISDAGVKIHYATLGDGPLVVMIRGFPDAGHFVQQDAAELVTSTMRWWLTMRNR